MASGENGPLDGDDPLGKNKQGTRLDFFVCSPVGSVLFHHFCFLIRICFEVYISFPTIK